MDNGFVCYEILKHRVKHGDIVSVYNSNPDWPLQKVLIVKDAVDEISCIHMDLPIANLSIRCKWRDIMSRSSQPVTRIGNSIQYNSFGNAYHHADSLFATVRMDLLSHVMASGVARIDNEHEEAERIKQSGNRVIRIPDQDDVRQYMREVVSTVGSQIAFDPVFANCEHWVTMKRYNMAWSSQVSSIVADVGVWKFILEIANGGSAVISHFFRSFGDYTRTPLGRQCGALINQVLPAVDMFAAETMTLGSGFRLTQTSFRALVSTGGAVAVIVSVLMWFWASLKDIVTAPRGKIITSEAELGKAYECIDHFPVVCNMGLLACSIVPKVWNRFITWLLNIASKILITLEGGLPQIQS